MEGLEISPFEKLFTRGAQFLGAYSDFEEAGVVLLGAPMDYTSSFRPGSRHAPNAIRLASETLEEYSLSAGRELRSLRYFDAGDLSLPFGNVSASLKIIEEATVAISTGGRVPFMIGGDHLVTLPAVQALRRFYPDLAVLHFDAHADLRPDYLGEVLSHASVIYRLAEDAGITKIYQFGIRSATAEEMAFAAAGRTRLFADQLCGPLQAVLAELQGCPLYLSVDIDLVDPAFAPGTGTPEPGGITAREFLRLPELLAGVRVVGLDLVEVSPPYDTSGITAILAAKFIRETLLFLF